MIAKLTGRIESIEEGRCIVDVNGVAGYQAGQDLVIELDNAQNLGSLSAGNFGH